VFGCLRNSGRYNDRLPTSETVTQKTGEVMTDKPYANHNFQLDRLCETFRQTEEALSLGIHDMHDRLEMERHVEQMKVDIA